MSYSIRMSEGSDFAPSTGEPRSEKREIKEGTIFVRSSMVSELPRSIQTEATCHESWTMVSGSNPEEVGQKLIEAGWMHSRGGSIKESAFGCDSQVLQRAVNRALQKAANNDLDCVEITGVTQHQNSGLNYVSLFARARILRREPVASLVG